MAKTKKINFELIPDYDGDDGGHRPETYRLMDELREECHEHLADARIALAWRKELKPDVDGHLVLGKCIKASDLQRELVNWDFVILLNREIWHDLRFSREQKLALLDHELCHAELALDEDGYPKLDEKGRNVWRTRKHDIEEFQAVIERHGCYKRDLERFAETLVKSKKAADSLFKDCDTTVSEFSKRVKDITHIRADS